MKQTEAEFLKALDKRLWTAADKLRSNLDAAVYKHVVLGLIFLKYVSDAFNEQREELQVQFRDPNHDYYLGDDEALIAEELEVCDYYTEKNVFWVPALARWDFLKAHAKIAPGTDIEVKNGKRTTYKFVSLGCPFLMIRWKKMKRLVAQLQAQTVQARKLDEAIAQNLKGLGYE